MEGGWQNAKEKKGKEKKEKGWGRENNNQRGRGCCSKRKNSQR